MPPRSVANIIEAIKRANAERIDAVRRSGGGWSARGEGGGLLGWMLEVIESELGE